MSVAQWIDAYASSEAWGRTVVGGIISSVVFGGAFGAADSAFIFNKAWYTLVTVLAVLALISFGVLILTVPGLVLFRGIVWVVTGE